MATLSSGVYDSELVKSTNKYFLEQKEKYGYSPELIAAWRNKLVEIPEFDKAVEDIVKAKGIDINLKGRDYDNAVQTIINGMMEGVVSKSSSKYVSNPGVLTAAQMDAAARNNKSLKLDAAAHGLVEDETSPTGFRYDITQDPKYANELWKYKIKDGKINGYSDEYAKAVKDGLIKGGTTSGKGSNTERTTSLKKGVRVSWTGNDPTDADERKKFVAKDVGEDEEHVGIVVDYDELPEYAQKIADKYIKDGSVDDYDYYFRPFEGGTFNDTEASLEIIPRGSKISDVEDEFSGFGNS